MSVSTFKFIIRVINPCKYSSFTTINNYVYNTLYPDTTLATISTSVLLPKTATFSEWTDQASIAYTTADQYTLCGTRTYSYSPTYTWLTYTSATKTFTVSPTLSS